MSKLPKKTKPDLYKEMGCQKCEFKMRSQKGCIKFGFTREEINAGVTLHLSDGAYVSLSDGGLCPYANRRQTCKTAS